MRLSLLLTIVLLLIGCKSINLKNDYLQSGYKVKFVGSNLTAVSFHKNVSQPYITSFGSLKNIHLTTITLNSNSELRFSLQIDKVSACDNKNLASLITQFFILNDTFGHLLQKRHKVDILIAKDTLFHVENKVTKKGNIYMSRFAAPLSSCTDKEVIWQELFEYIHIIFHEIYHIDDLQSNKRKDIEFLEYSATKKSHCDFFKSSNFSEFSISPSSLVIDDDTTDHVKGYRRFHIELFNITDSMVIRSDMDVYEKVLKWCKKN